jgi:hypothetical protein
MQLKGDTYTCPGCRHFRQNPLLQDLVERDDRSNLKFCNCEHCPQRAERRAGVGFDLVPVKPKTQAV